MEQLIKITTKGDQQLVSARDVHAYLEVKKHFTEWFEDNKVMFTDGVDYQAFHLEVKAGPGTTRKIDYTMTLDCAKEMCMMSKVAKGKQARQYFIECEKQLRGFSIPLDYKQAVKALLQQIEINEQVEERLQAVQPKVDFYDKVAESNDAVSMDKAAQLLKTGRTRLFKELRARHIMKPNSTTPYQKYVDAGYFVLIEKPWEHEASGETRISITTQVTQKGIQYINKHVLA